MPRDQARYDKVMALRNEGRTFREIGEALGVTANRARQMHESQKHRTRMAIYRAENPTPPEWFEGLSRTTVWELHRFGFSSRQDCMILTAENLEFYYSTVVIPGRDRDRGGPYYDDRLPIKVVNEVRVWLGFKPIERPGPNLDRARKLLEKHGWRCTKDAKK